MRPPRGHERPVEPPQTAGIVDPGTPGTHGQGDSLRPHPPGGSGVSWAGGPGRTRSRAPLLPPAPRGGRLPSKRLDRQPLGNSRNRLPLSGTDSGSRALGAAVRAGQEVRRISGAVYTLCGICTRDVYTAGMAKKATRRSRPVPRFLAADCEHCGRELPAEGFCPCAAGRLAAYRAGAAAIQDARQRQELELAALVRRARADGLRWDEIGEPWGLSRQGAWNRWGSVTGPAYDDDSSPE